MAKYKKKPIIIEAIQWTGKNEIEIYNFLEDKEVKSSQEISSTGKNFLIDFNNDITMIPILLIKTLEGDMIASKSDYIIKGIKGEFYPCKADIFKSSYELIEIEND